ncbi:MAG: DUF424 family protein [Aigarchaeota archaeon]|nr:DUF424 family protein [Aigarchaeota archaeon]MCX8192295.1 DUF424 family protein [Nitrososphaeria archaeon]MDW7986097.1 DUF424 family protein [Nitrososphaerota archaeon]
MSKRFWVKVHHSKTGEVVVAICDEELLGKRISIVEGFSVEVSKSFYGDVLVKEEDLPNYFKQGTIINLLGEFIVNYALHHGIIVERAVMKIGGVPHIQIYV